MSNTSKPSNSNSRSAPWEQWSKYTSTDKDNPDPLEIKVVETKPFQTKYSIAVKLLLRKDNQWAPYYLSLKSNDSTNAKFLHIWEKYERLGKIRIGAEFVIGTFLRKSKTSGWTMRDFTEPIFMEDIGEGPKGVLIPIRKREGGEKRK